MSRFTHDTSNVGNGLETVFGKLILEPLKMIACLVGAAWVCWRLLAALADRRPAGRAGHPLAEQDAQAGQSPGDGADGADLQRPGRDLPRHQDRQGLHQRALRAQAVPPPQQGILPQVDEDRPLRFPLAPHYRVHGHPHRLPGAVGRGVAGAQGRDPPAGHPADLAAAGPQLALAVLRLPLRHGRSGAEVLRHLQPAAMRRGGQRPDLRLPGPRAGHPQPEESRALPAASARAVVRRRVVRISARHAGLGRRDAADPLRRDDRDRRPQRLRQVDAGQFDPAFCRSRSRARSAWTACRWPTSACASCAGRSAW